MRKGERRARPSARLAAEDAYAFWLRRYGKPAETAAAHGPVVGACILARYAFHAGVRWARQDERRRRGESRMAVLLKKPEPVCACGHLVRHHSPGGCAGGCGAGGTLSYGERPCPCLYVREH